MKRIQWSNGYPDLFIVQPNATYNGLFLELKIETPYKINGELKKSDHLENQQLILNKLNERGYYATFTTGFDEARKVIDWYLRC